MSATSSVKLVLADKSGGVQLKLAFTIFVSGPFENITLTAQRCFWKHVKSHSAFIKLKKGVGRKEGTQVKKKKKKQ